MNKPNQKLSQEHLEYIVWLKGSYWSPEASKLFEEKFSMKVSDRYIRKIRASSVMTSGKQSIGVNRLSWPTMTIEREYDWQIGTIDELLEQFEIDPSEWFIDRCNITKSDKIIKTKDSVTSVPVTNIKASLSRAPYSDTRITQAIMDATVDVIKEKSHKVKETKTDWKNMLLLNIFDAHFGKLCIDHSTWERHWTSETELDFIEVAYGIIQKAKRDNLAKIVIPIGNDLLNFDWPKQETTKWTHQDTDTLYRDLFRVVISAVNKVVTYAWTIAPVELLFIEGNHDWVATFHLREVFKAMYTNNENVQVVDCTSPRQYLLYGNSLMWFTHGEKEKIDSLPSLMLRECAWLLKEAKYFDWYLWHTHTSKHWYNKISDELGWVHINFESSISPTDGRHHEMGYVGNRRWARGVVYSESRWPIATYPYYL